ncbi:hypothetical protein BZA77DRAFT_20719 [Pyronema omphalodes]|nr:hypothetical protein BZA77DRAFT_20719 [Pyronema omphalodes]
MSRPNPRPRSISISTTSSSGSFLSALSTISPINTPGQYQTGSSSTLTTPVSDSFPSGSGDDVNNPEAGGITAFIPPDAEGGNTAPASTSASASAAGGDGVQREESIDVDILQGSYNASHAPGFDRVLLTGGSSTEEKWEFTFENNDEELASAFTSAFTSVSTAQLLSRNSRIWTGGYNQDNQRYCHQYYHYQYRQPQSQLTIIPLELLHAITSFLSLKDLGALTRTHPELYIRLNKTLYRKAPKDILIRQVKICSDPWLNRQWEKANGGKMVGRKWSIFSGEGRNMDGGMEMNTNKDSEMGKTNSKINSKDIQGKERRQQRPTPQSQNRHHQHQHQYQHHQSPQDTPQPFYSTRIMTSTCVSLLSKSQIPKNAYPIPSFSLPLIPYHPIHTLTSISHLLSGPKSLIQQRLDATDSAGYTALHWAARRGDLMMVKYLVGMGAKTSGKNIQGHTVLGCARLWEDTEGRQGRVGSEGFLTGFLEEAEKREEREREMEREKEKEKEMVKKGRK